MQKYVFTTFAHSAQSPLAELLTEDSGINELLQPHSVRKGYRLLRETFATADKISKNFQSYGNQIVVFHYSGHADGDSVMVGDIDISIANHLEKSARTGVLKLVFLNGCSTQGQVKRLLSAGVPAIIATHTKVDDKLASKFAIYFFEKLTNGGMSISKAFQEAIEYIQGFTTRLFDGESRGVDYIDKNYREGEPIWGLYHRFPEDTELNPFAEDILPPPWPPGFIVNKRLRETLFSALIAAGNATIINLQEKKTERIVEDSEIEKEINAVLPMPVGEHLRKLFSYTDNPDGYERINVHRIDQICRVYCSTVELISYVLISQLWESKNDNLPADLVEKLQNHFYLSSTERLKFDYIPLLKSILAFLNDEPHIIYFIDELSNFEQLLEPTTKFSKACAGLTKLNIRRLNDDISATEVESLCERAENELSDIFEELGFLHRYKLTSIQAISVLKYRYNTDTYFTHSVVPLMGIDSSKSYYELKDSLSCEGVVLIKGDLHPRDLTRRIMTAQGRLEFLNLSPFMIDRNAFKGDKSFVVSFNVYDEYLNGYRYKDISKPERDDDNYKVGSDKDCEHLRAELEHYQKTILNTEKLP